MKKQGDMKIKKKFPKIVFICYIVLICLFLALFTFIGCKDDVNIYQAREESACKKIQNYRYTEIENPDDPLGVSMEYQWTLKGIGKGDYCLAFYTVHQYVEVSLGDELMYQMVPDQENVGGKTVGSHWVVIPLYSEDEGKDISVYITPVYESVRNRKPEFHMGSRFFIFIEQLKQDFYPIILSAAIIVVGLIFGFIAILGYHRKGEKPDLIYLAASIIMIGIWKITDIRFFPWLLEGSSLFFSYITLGMLALAGVPFIIFIQRQFSDSFPKLCRVSCILGIVSGYVVWFLQITDLADMRESLYFSHITIAVTVLTVICVIVGRWRKKKNDVKMWITIVFFALCTVGTAADLLGFYIKGNSDGLLNTVGMFLVYAVVMGAYSTVQIRRKVYIDDKTGLYNQSRCNEVLADPRPLKASVGLIMFDLNNLKVVNDTMGHEVGDYLICGFATDLKKNISRKCFMGRYGGDEFIVIVRKTNNGSMEEILERLAASVKEMNQSGDNPDISYSAGYTISSGKEVMQELFEKADEKMYIEKKRYHASEKNKYL